MHSGAPPELYHRARELRNQGTQAEDVLWTYLKTKPLGYKFRRQHPYSVYILDFYCHQLKLVIEVDGSIHYLEEVKANDLQRQKLLEETGLKVIRFSNDQILKELNTVINIIEQVLHEVQLR